MTTIRRISRADLGWIIGYLGLMILIIAALFHYRQVAVAALASPAAQADWQAWKQAEEDRSRDPDALVRRKPPRSDEPPHLVLLRDHFPAVLGSLLLITSFFYGFLALTLRGAFGQTEPGPNPEPEGPSSHSSFSGSVPETRADDRGSL